VRKFRPPASGRGNGRGNRRSRSMSAVSRALTYRARSAVGGAARRNGRQCLRLSGHLRPQGREHYEGYVGTRTSRGSRYFRATAILCWCRGIPKCHSSQSPKLDPSRFWIKDARIGNYGSILVEVLKSGLDRAHVGVIALRSARPDRRKASSVHHLAQGARRPAAGAVR